jgi:hypothetical protein
VRSVSAVLASLLATLALVGCAGSETVSLESVAHAATTTRSAGSSRMAMEMSVEVGGKTLKVLANGAFDYKRMRGWMEMDLGALSALTDGKPSPRMTMLFDGATVWMRVPPELSSLGQGKPWLRTTVGGRDMSMGMQSPDPSQMLQTLRGVSDSVEKRGHQRVRGVETTHYRAKIDLQKAMGQAPAREREQAQSMLKLFGLGTVPVDLYLDDANRVRRMKLEYDYEVFEQKLSAELKLDLFDFGVRVPFKRPPASQVAELPSMLQPGN